MVDTIELEYLVVSIARILVTECDWQILLLQKVAKRATLPLSNPYVILPLKEILLLTLSEVVDRAMLEKAESFWKVKKCTCYTKPLYA